VAKILLVIVIAGAVYFICRAYARAVARSQAERSVPRTQSKPDEDMVQCCRCGIHLPRSEACVADDAYFCSDEHRRLHGS